MLEKEQFFSQIKNTDAETVANYIGSSVEKAENALKDGTIDTLLDETYRQMPDDEQNAFNRVIQSAMTEHQRFAVAYFLGAGGTKIELLTKHASGLFVGHSLYGSLMAMTENELGALLYA